MTHSYSQRSLVVLAFLGILSAIMSVLSVILIFQLQTQQAVIKDSSTLGSSEITAVLMAVSTVLSALSLTLNLSSVVVCLLHSYFATEICRGEPDTQRADWFLLDNRVVRHVTIGLFCLGVSVYLAAMSIYMLLMFEVETGIASVCVLSSGVLVLLLIVIHSLIRAAHTAKHFHNEHAHTMYHSNPESIAGIHTSNLSIVEKPQRQHSLANLHSHFINPAHIDPNSQYWASIGPCSDKDGYSGGGSGRTHRTLSTESGLFQAQAKPWNGVNSEMRSVLARKATIKDSTLV
ncbi:transmembrane protein 221 [Sinocyclocheilus anshuiensis]|uniref:Transmembrane protein 221-like n=1 Tax=Sinocyclocheilus anshuiensis TaxID=1608454 RepID=A0A671LZE6_9TELE|nr:PREDICTED: transmembrane protein 221-like [Sinocyclocheilus anshuiensis]